MATSTEGSWGANLSGHDNLAALLAARAEEHGDDVFGRFPDRDLTFAETAERSAALAGGLSELGVGPGTRVCAMMYNAPEFVELLFAVARLGGVLVPVNVSLRGDDLAYTLDDADAPAVVVGPECVEKYEEIRGAVPFEDELLVDHDDSDAATSYGRLADYYAGDGADIADVTQSDTATIVYTGGTTGMPKGVELPHGAYLSTATELVERVVRPTREDTLYMSQPLFHIFGQIVVIESLVAGTTFAMEKWFSKSKFWNRVAKYDATIIHFATAIADIIHNETEPPVDNPVRLGVGAIEEDLQESFGEKVGCQVLPLYGLTECAGIVTSGTVDDSCLGSIGKPLRYADVAVVDREDEPVPTGEEGQIVVRPARANAMMKGYFKRPDATTEETRNQWIHTGDVGYKDDDGRLHFVERMSHFVRVKGENVSVYEVEATLNSHPAVAESAVVGVPADVGGEDILAAVRFEPGESVDPADLVAYCNETAAYFKVPRYILPVDSIPKTETKQAIERHEFDDRAEDAWDREDAGVDLER